MADSLSHSIDLNHLCCHELFVFSRGFTGRLFGLEALFHTNMLTTESKNHLTENSTGISGHIVPSEGFHMLNEHLASKVTCWCDKAGSPIGLQTVPKTKEKRPKEAEYENRWYISVWPWHSMTNIWYREQTKHVTWTVSEHKHLSSTCDEKHCAPIEKQMWQNVRLMWVLNVSLLKMSLSKSCLSTFVWISLLPNTWKTVLFNIQKRFCSFR